MCPNTPEPCPLCGSVHREDFAELGARRYFRCPDCDLVWLCPAQRLNAEAEYAHYGLHRNDPADVRYRRFLERLVGPLSERLPPGSQGLDYGSGPGPTLSLMLAERGFPMAIYDPFFAPDGAVLDICYDFITCTETAEHFHAPGEEFARLDRLLKPGGLLGVMTEVRTPERNFATWHYVRDPTHVCFYSVATLHWLARCRGWELRLPGRNIAIFRKPG